MKKALSLLLVICLLFALTGCRRVMHGTDDLIEKAREIIPVADAENIEITYAGLIGDDDDALIWFVSGNEYQAHYYLPMECKIVGKDAYTFVHEHKPIDRGTDIVALQWNGGYAFLVNNPKCTTIRIINITGTHDISIKEGTYPFVYYNELLPSEYYFLDAEGKEIP